MLIKNSLTFSASIRVYHILIRCVFFGSNAYDRRERSTLGTAIILSERAAWIESLFSFIIGSIFKSIHKSYVRFDIVENRFFFSKFSMCLFGVIYFNIDVFSFCFISDSFFFAPSTNQPMMIQCHEHITYVGYGRRWSTTISKESSLFDTTETEKAALIVDIHPKRHNLNLNTMSPQKNIDIYTHTHLTTKKYYNKNRKKTNNCAVCINNLTGVLTVWIYQPLETKLFF